MGRRKSRYFWKNCLDNRRQLLKGGLDDCSISFWATEVEGVVGMESEEASHASMLLLGLKKRGTRKPLEISSSACTIANGESEIGRSKLKSWGTLKNLFEGESFGSISMKEASSSEREALKELSRLSKDGFRFTSQLYEDKCDTRSTWYFMNLIDVAKPEKTKVPTAVVERGGHKGSSEEAKARTGNRLETKWSPLMSAERVW
nr:hypothetical protein MIMGU_mgv1a016901mg [Ipomoea batatas]